LTRAELEAVMPLAGRVPDAVVDALDAAMRRFEIDTPPRMAAFSAQLAHESGQLQRWAENLSYRWERLRQVFPKYFPSDEAARPFDRKPERIANRVYANRMGNGPESSGDGWRYRGRGPIQLTGRDNYRACGQGIGVNLAADPDLDRGGAAKRHAVRIDAVRTDGSRLSVFVEQRRGSAEHPLPKAEVEQKFRRLAAVSLTATAIDELVAIVDRLEQEPDVTRLAALITADRRRER
jgi:predicted chitinase